MSRSILKNFKIVLAVSILGATFCLSLHWANAAADIRTCTDGYNTNGRQSTCWVSTHVPDDDGSDAAGHDFVQTNWEDHLCADGYNRGQTGTRADVDAHAYVENGWLSERNAPYVTDEKDITASQSSINMQFNQLNFLCAIVRQPAMNAPTHLSYNEDNQVNNSHYPADNGPVPDNGSVNAASLYEQRTDIMNIRPVSLQEDGYTQGSKGSVNGYNQGNQDDQVGYQRNLSSRYWWANPENFVYQLPSSSAARQPGHTYTVTIEIKYKQIITYHAYGNSGTSLCQNKDTSGADAHTGTHPTSYNNFGDCGYQVRAYTFKYKIDPQWNLNNSTQVAKDCSSWTTSNVSTASTSSTVCFKHDVSNDRHSDNNADYNWRVEGCYHADGSSCQGDTDYAPSSDGSNGRSSGGASVRSGGCGNSNANSSWMMGCYDQNVQPNHDGGGLAITFNYNFPDNAPVGARYCQRIAYDNGNGPNTTDNSNGGYGANSNGVCVVYAPGVHLSLSCPAEHLTGEVDGGVPSGGRYRLTFSPATGITNTATDGTFNVDVSSYVAAHGNRVTYTVTATDSQGHTDTATAPCSATSAACGSVTATHNTTLPDAPSPAPAGSNSGPGAPGGTTSTRGDTYYQEEPQKQQITDAHDQYTPGPTTLTFSPTTAQPRGSTFTIDYSNYINQYPYDDHHTTIDYTQKYKQTVWTADTFDHYQCGSATNASDTCSVDATGTTNTYCPSGYSYYQGSTCHKATGDPLNQRGRCQSGEFLDGSSSTCYVHHAQVSTTTYSCPAGGTLNNTTHKCTSPATKYYKYTASSPNYPIAQGTYESGSSALPDLPELCPRTFTVQYRPSTDVTQVNLVTADDPTSASILTTVTVKFTEQPGATGKPLRHLMAENNLISYAGQYEIDHATGSTTALSTDNYGPFSVSCTGGDGCLATEPHNPTVNLPSGSMKVGDQVCAQFTVTPHQEDVDENGDSLGVDDASAVPSTTIPGGNTCSAPMQNKPYARFYGNDVLAGSYFAGGTCDPISAINMVNNGAAGAGSQFAAMSLGAINGFASAFLRNINPTPPTGLSLANTGDHGSTAYGGNFAWNNTTNHYDTTDCVQVPDYYHALMPKSNVTDAHSPLTYNVGSNSGPVKLAQSGGTPVELTGDNDISGSNALFVDGNVYISGDQTYDGSGRMSGDTVTDVPSLYVIAKGNIYISPNVKHLDGVYIAQGATPGNGLIRDCALSTGDAYGSNDLYNNCDHQLVVTGSFIADTVDFDRAYASLRNGNAGDGPFQTSPVDCDAGNTPLEPPVFNDCAAEIFNFTPENYLSSPALNPNAGPDQNKYDYITSLSPVL